MNKLALCVGVNDYPGMDSDLRGAVNDCHDWAETLSGRGFNVNQLRDMQATRSSLLAALTDLIKGIHPGGTGVFFYSGHGTWMPDTNGDEPDGMDEALVPYDIGTAGPLLDDTIADIIAAYKQPDTKLVMVFDCCHSGSIAKGGMWSTEIVRRPKFLPPTKFVAGLPSIAAGVGPRRKDANIPGVITISGCQDFEYSYDTSFDGRANGALTYFATRAMVGASNYRDWFRKIKRSLPHKQLPQTPVMTGTPSCQAWPVF